MCLHQLDLDSHRLGLVHASRALLGGKTVARPLDIEHRATLGQQRRELTSLDAANLFVIGCNAEYRHLMHSAQLFDVFCVAIEDDPANAGDSGGTRHLRKRCSAGRLENDGIRTRHCVGLDYLE